MEEEASQEGGTVRPFLFGVSLSAQLQTAIQEDNKSDSQPTRDWRLASQRQSPDPEQSTAKAPLCLTLQPGKQEPIFAHTESKAKPLLALAI